MGDISTLHIVLHIQSSKPDFPRDSPETSSNAAVSDFVIDGCSS